MLTLMFEHLNTVGEPVHLLQPKPGKDASWEGSQKTAVGTSFKH